jgi:hypothetical protein
MVTQGAKCYDGQKGACSVNSFAQAAAVGVVTGSIGEALGGAASGLVSAAGDALGGIFSGAAGAAGDDAAANAITDTAETAARQPPAAVAKNAGQPPAPAPAAGVARGADFIANQDGTIVSTSRARLEGGFQDAGFPSSPTRSPGMQYTLPDGSLVRVMEPSGQAPLRASFTDSYGNAINPFTGKQPMPPPGVSGAAWRQMMRSLTHVELGP